MKKVLFSVVIVAILSVILSSCDKIEGNYYEIIKNEDVNVEFPQLNPSDVYRKVLVDEFTGHRCTNCPDGHRILDNLHQRYGDTLVMIGIHYGSLAKPLGSLFGYDFRIEEGNQIGQDYEIDGIPAAIFNRNFKSGGWSREQWTSVATNLDRSEVYAAVQLVNVYDAASNSVKANVKVTMLKDYENKLNLALYLVEDGIVKPQKDGAEDIEDYVHNHVLRAALNGAYGTILNNGEPLRNGESVTYAATVGFNNTDWNKDNCYIVAVLEDVAQQEVLQVESSNVTIR